MRSYLGFREREMFLSKKLLGFIGTLLVISCGNTTQFQEGSDNSEKKSQGPLDGDATRGNQEISDSKSMPNEHNSIAAKPSQSLPSMPADGTLREVEMTFQGASYQEANLTFAQDYMELSHVVMRESGYKGQTVNFEQVTRLAGSKSFDQGTAGKSVEEVFTQNDLGIIDILVVVDNSGSMGGEHEKVKKNLPDLISQVSGANWQIRIVSTDGRLDEADPTKLRDKCDRFSLINENNPQDFEASIGELGVQGSGNEQGVFKAIKGLDCSDDQWVRDGSNLAVLIVTDEDNCSTSCGNDAQNTPAELKTLMGSAIGNSQTVRTVGEDARVYGIFIVPGQECEAVTDEYYDLYKADEYYSLVTDTSGYAGSICDEKYDDTFKEISKDMKNQLKSTFELANTPENGSLLISMRMSENDPYLPLVQGVDYTITAKTIEFVNTPAPNASIKATYLYDSVPKFSEVDLELEPGAIESVRIMLESGDMLELAADKYQVSGTKITFVDEPADNSTVIVSYRENLPALENSFPLAASYKEGSVKAKVDGQEASFAVKNGAVEFTSIPKDGSSIELTYDVPYVGGIVNKISTEVDSSIISELKAWDEQTGDSIEITLEDQNFVLSSDSISEGQSVKIKYRLASSDGLLAYELPFIPSDSIQIFLVDEAGAKTECPVSEFSLDEKNITLDCNIDGLTQVDVSFKYLLGGIQEFQTNFENPDTATWTVLVNGKENSTFVRIGNTIGIPDLPAEASVVIKAIYPSNSDNSSSTETASLTL